MGAAGVRPEIYLRRDRSRQLCFAAARARRAPTGCVSVQPPCADRECATDTPVYKWFHDNATSFDFVRTVNVEPWHREFDTTKGGAKKPGCLHGAQRH
jgi:hypothetical protein